MVFRVDKFFSENVCHCFGIKQKTLWYGFEGFPIDYKGILFYNSTGIFLFVIWITMKRIRIMALRVQKGD